MKRHAKVKNRSLLRSGRCLLALAAIAAAPIAPSLFAGRVLLPADLLMVMLPFRAHAAELGFRRVSNPILDAVQQFWPWRRFAGQQLRRGIIPWWNPYMLCGTPFVANDQSAVFYPETWLFALMPPERAFAWAAFVYLLASGSFMFWFLRTMGLRRRAAMVGAVGWMYNGFVVGWMCLPSFRSVPGWLPLMLTAVATLPRARRPAAWIALGALAVAMNFLAGNLHISFYMLVIFAAFALWTALASRRKALVLAGAAAILALGAATASIQLLPTIEFAAHSHRRAISYATTLTYRLPWPYLAAGLLPDLFGNPVDYNHWGATLGQQYRAYTETAWYTGAITVVLAIVSLGRWRRRPEALMWAALVALAFALALGSPVDWLLYRFVPGFRQLPGINRAIVIACFAVPVLAALGAQRLLEWSGATCGERGANPSGATAFALRSNTASAAAALWIAAATTALFGLVATSWAWLASAPYDTAAMNLSRYTWLQFLRLVLVVAAPASAIHAALARRRKVFWCVAVAFLAADMGYFAAHFLPQVPARYCRPPSEIVETLRRQTAAAERAGRRTRIFSAGSNDITGRMPPNVPMLFGLYDIQGSDSITYGRYIRLLRALTAAPTPSATFSHIAAAVPRLGIRWLITDLDASPPATINAVEGRARLFTFASSPGGSAPDGPPAPDFATDRLLIASDDQALKLLAGESGRAVGAAAVVSPAVAQLLKRLGLALQRAEKVGRDAYQVRIRGVWGAQKPTVRRRSLPARKRAAWAHGSATGESPQRANASQLATAKNGAFCRPQAAAVGSGRPAGESWSGAVEVRTGAPKVRESAAQVRGAVAGVKFAADHAPGAPGVAENGALRMCTVAAAAEVPPPPTPSTHGTPDEQAAARQTRRVAPQMYDAAPRAAAAPASTARAARALRVFRPEPSMLRVESADGAPLVVGRVLVVRETCYPGWRAYAGGSALAVVPVDYCFAGIPLTLARPVQEIMLVFEPATAKVGGFLTCLGLAVLAALFASGAADAWRGEGGAGA